MLQTPQRGFLVFGRLIELVYIEHLCVRRGRRDFLTYRAGARRIRRVDMRARRGRGRTGAGADAADPTTPYFRPFVLPTMPIEMLYATSAAFYEM